MVFKKGYKMSEEHKRKLIESIKLNHKVNENYGMKNKKHNSETIEKMRQKAIGRKMTESQLLNWSNAMDKLRQEGRLIAWNKGLTTRTNPYINNRYKSHKVWTNYNLYHVPKGFHVHHIDLDSNNNHIDNLFLMSKSDHAILHNVICKEMRLLK